MKHCLTAILLLLSACAVPGRVVDVRTGSELSCGDLAERLRGTDVVFLGELHHNDDGHRTHLALVHDLFELRPDLVISMEMFERDVQMVLWEYLLGGRSEDSFLAEARPWKRYGEHYRPFIEFAKENAIPVLAANAPRELAARVAKEGLASVAGDRHVARDVQAPKNEYWDDFRAAMGGHPGMEEEVVERYYEAQCLKDETMAESIVDYLMDAGADGRRPLVVHICGAFHSNHGRGTVARVARRGPNLRLSVVSMQEIEGVRLPAYDLPGPGDYVVVVDRQKRPTGAAGRPTPAKKVEEPKSEPPTAPPAGPGTGDRPALGFLPDYEYDERDGVRVDEVSPGGSAERAGMASGDVILTVSGKTTAGLESYMEVLSELSVGDEAEVLLRRGDELKRLKVKVSRR